jgi:hypothetical protein
MKKRNRIDYIEIRINQLKEDLSKTNQGYDRQWYNRLIQELDWARQMESQEVTNNCYMEDPKHRMDEEKYRMGYKNVGGYE